MNNFEKPSEVEVPREEGGEKEVTQEQVEKRLDTLCDTLEEAVLERYRKSTGENPATIEDTTEEGMKKTMEAWSNMIEGLFVGSPAQIKSEIDKYGDKGFDVHKAHARLGFILGNRNRESEADKNS